MTNEKYEVDLNPKISEYKRIGKKTVLKIRKIVYTRVFTFRL